MDTDATTAPPSPRPPLKATEGTAEATAGTGKKYIRTFAGDMAAVQKGERPDLAPLVKSQPIQELEPTPEPSAPIPPPKNPEPLPISAVPVISATPAERLVAASPVVSPPAKEPAPVEPTPEPELPPPPEPKKASPLETYANDFSEHLKEQHASPVTVLAAEQDAHTKKVETSKPVPRSRSGLLYSIAGAVFLVAGGFGVYFAYTHYATSLPAIPLVTTISAPISVDDRQEISGTGSALMQAIEQSVSRLIASGSVRLLYIASNDSVFSTLQTPAPDVLLRNLKSDGSMTGVVNISGNQSPFFILSVTSYGETFSGMLQWESSMPRDLAGLFPPFPAPVENISTATSTPVATTTATTTPKIGAKKVATTPTLAVGAPTTSVGATTTPIVSKVVIGFRDEVVNNHDVRIYRDAVGRSILLYGYWNQTTLIIARAPSAFTEILNRLANSRTQ